LVDDLARFELKTCDVCGKTITADKARSNVTQFLSSESRCQCIFPEQLESAKAAKAQYEQRFEGKERAETLRHVSEAAVRKDLEAFGDNQNAKPSSNQKDLGREQKLTEFKNVLQTITVRKITLMLTIGCTFSFFILVAAFMQHAQSSGNRKSVSVPVESPELSAQKLFQRAEAEGKLGNVDKQRQILSVIADNADEANQRKAMLEIANTYRQQHQYQLALPLYKQIFNERSADARGSKLDPELAKQYADCLQHVTKPLNWLEIRRTNTR